MRSLTQEQGYACTYLDASKQYLEPDNFVPAVLLACPLSPTLLF
jgi:hypothetical protein